MVLSSEFFLVEKMEKQSDKNEAVSKVAREAALSVALWVFELAAWMVLCKGFYLAALLVS